MPEFNALTLAIIGWARRLTNRGSELHRHIRERHGLVVPDWLNEEIPATSDKPTDETVARVLRRAMNEGWQ